MRLSSRISVLIILGVFAGCAKTPSSSSTPTPARGAGLDPCAAQLHDLCDALLLYSARYQMLPPTLEQLRLANGTPASSLVCPVSRQPYVYNPDGLIVPGTPGRVILHDAEPSHTGARGAIVVIPQSSGSLIVRVVALPEPQFRKAAPASDLP